MSFTLKGTCSLVFAVIRVIYKGSTYYVIYICIYRMHACSQHGIIIIIFKLSICEVVVFSHVIEPPSWHDW